MGGEKYSGKWGKRKRGRHRWNGAHNRVSSRQWGKGCNDSRALEEQADYIGKEGGNRKDSEGEAEREQMQVKRDAEEGNRQQERMQRIQERKQGRKYR